MTATTERLLVFREIFGHTILSGLGSIGSYSKLKELGVLKSMFHPSYLPCPLPSTSHNVQWSSFSKYSFLRDLRVRAHLLKAERTVIRMMMTTN